MSCLLRTSRTYRGSSCSEGLFSSFCLIFSSFSVVFVSSCLFAHSVLLPIVIPCKPIPSPLSLHLGIFSPIAIPYKHTSFSLSLHWGISLITPLSIRRGVGGEAVSPPSPPLPRHRYALPARPDNRMADGTHETAVVGGERGHPLSAASVDGAVFE